MRKEKRSKGTRKAERKGGVKGSINGKEE